VTYSPFVDVTEDMTAFYTSDCHVLLFPVDENRSKPGGCRTDRPRCISGLPLLEQRVRQQHARHCDLLSLR
jgi:hypothetical protein